MAIANEKNKHVSIRSMPLEKLNLEKKLNDKKKKHPYTVVFNGIERVLSKEDYETMEEHLHHL